MDMNKMIDFSSRHDVLILNEDGTLSPMDEPYFRAVQLNEDTWKIESDGDFCYLAAGENVAISIDTGYGAGNIRAFEQTLTRVPVCFAANTHDHFDHTAGNGYYDAVYMSAETQPLATRPYPSFGEISFPKARQERIVSDGDRIDLGNRTLQVISMPDHAAGSLLFLDEKNKMLFAGDELGDMKRINGTVEHVCTQLQALMQYRNRFDTICAGPGVFPGDVADRLLAATERILAGSEGEMVTPRPYQMAEAAGYEGKTIYRRRDARLEDLPKDFDKPDPYKRLFTFDGVKILYDVRRIR